LASEKRFHYQQQDCTLTLSQCLDEFYAGNGEKFKKPQPVDDWTTLLLFHDATHVVFGLDTDMVDEALGDTWSLLGTNLRMKEYLRYLKEDGAKELIREVGWRKMITGTLRAIPRACKVFISSRKMNKKWPIRDFQKYLDTPINEIRKEFNVTLV